MPELRSITNRRNLCRGARLFQIFAGSSHGRPMSNLLMMISDGQKIVKVIAKFLNRPEIIMFEAVNALPGHLQKKYFFVWTLRQTVLSS
jgi:hypothetical protein